MIDTVHQKLVSDGVREALQQLGSIQQKILPLNDADLHQQAEALEVTLRSIADVNKKPISSLNIKFWRLRNLTDDLRQMYTSYFIKHKIEFKTQGIEDVLVNTDKMTFFHICFNLIYYMGTYVDVTPNIRSFISLEAKVYNEEFIVIYIEDNGKYPPAVRQKTSFDKPSYSQKVLDSIAGVGLAIVKEWVIALKGSIQMVDKLNQGMKFCLVIPGKQNTLVNEKLSSVVRSV